MKKVLSIKYIYICIFIFSVFLTSCQPNDEFLKETPKSSLFPESFYTNAAELELGLVALYGRAYYPCYKDHDGGIIVALMGGDDMTTQYNNILEVDIFQASSGNVFLSNFWGTTYDAVKAANSLILNYQRAVDATEQQRDEAAGAAYFIRAWCYYNLVRVFNEVPLVTGVDVNWTIEKSSTQEIYDLIVADLINAEKMLPVRGSVYTRTEMVAPTQGSAKAFLASVYLTMAGYPLKQTDKYALAAAKAKEVIDNVSTYGYKLLDNYAALWAALPLKHDELVWGQFHQGGNNQRAPYAGMPAAYGGWDVYFAEIKFFNDFPEGPRKDATFMTTFPQEDGRVLDWTETLHGHPYYKKMWETDGYDWDIPWKSANWQSSRTNQTMRYAEVLLTYAEAQAMADGTPNTLAYDCVNNTRTRAGLTELTSGLSGVAFRDSVVMERGWEFAGPEFASRWFDLVRLERVEEAALNRDPSETPIPRQPTKEDYFKAIPEDEVLRNPNLGKK